MGRKQQNTRNTKIASSERTASLLAATGATNAPLTTFFPTLGAVAANDSEAQQLALDGELRLQLKKLLKKDAVTRVKGLDELNQMIKIKSPDYFIAFLPHWPRAFIRLATDIDRRVRESVFNVHQELCAKVGKQFAKIMKSTLAYWLIGQHDVYGPVASVAKTGFMKTFPEHKYLDVVSFYLQDILEVFQRNLFDTEFSFQEGSDLTAEEKETQLRDLQIGTLHCLRDVISRLTAAVPPKTEKLSVCKSYINDQFLWEQCKKSSSGHRAVYYELLDVCIQRQVIEVDKASKLLTEFLKEEDPSACVAAWNAAINLLHSNPDRCEALHSELRILDTLKKCITRRGFGNSRKFFPLMLPLFAQLKNKPEHRHDVLCLLQSSLLKHVPAAISSELSPICDAFFECLRYTLVHTATSAEEVLGIQNTYLIPLLKELILGKSRPVPRFESRIFRESWSLLLYMEKQASTEEKFEQNSRTYALLNEFVGEALKSNRLETLIAFYESLSLSLANVSQTKKSVRFSTGDQDCHRPSRITITDAIKDSDWFNGSVHFTIEVLRRSFEQPSPLCLELLNLTLTLFSSNALLESFKMSHNESEVINALPIWTKDESSPAAAIKVCLTLASVFEIQRGYGLQFILTVQKKYPDLLVFIIHEIATTTDKVQSFVSELFLEEAFSREITKALKGDESFVIAEKCLILRKNLPDKLIEASLKTLVDGISKETNERKPFQDNAGICRLIAALFQSDISVWAAPLISDVIVALHENYFAAFGTQDEVEDCDFRHLYLAPLSDDQSETLTCRAKILNDLNGRILKARKSDISSLTKYCDDFIQSQEETLDFTSLIPSTEQLDKLWSDSNLSDYVASFMLSQRGGLCLLEDGPYSTSGDVENFVSCCTVLSKICSEKKLQQLLNIEYVILAGLIEPRPSRLQASLAWLNPVWEQVISRVTKKKGIQWAFVLETVLKTNTPKSDTFWNDADYLQKQILIDFGLAENKPEAVVEQFVANISAENLHVDLEPVTLAARYLSRSNPQQSYMVRSILAALQGLKGKKPEMFDTTKPSAFHLALCSLFQTVVSDCPSCLETVNWDFVLLVTSTMAQNYPWKTVGSESRNAVSVGVKLCGLVVAIDSLSRTPDSLPVSVTHEWKEFYFSIVVRALVPVLTADIKALKSIPGPILEQVAQFYDLVDAQSIQKLWMDFDNDCDTAIDIMSRLCNLIFVKSPPIQIAAYALALRIMDEVAEEYVGEVGAVEFQQDTKIPDCLNCTLQDLSSLLNLIKKPHKASGISIHILSDEDRSVLSGYILTMSLIVKFGNKINPELRSGYVTHVEEAGYWNNYLDLLFELVQRESLKEALLKNSLPPMPLDPVSTVYWAILDMALTAPDVLKSWYTKLNNHKLESKVSATMTRYISPIVIEREYLALKSGKNDIENLTLQAMTTTREIVARYVLEDTGRTCEITIQMETCHPLKPMKINYDPDNVAISKTIWQLWMRQLNAFFHANNASVVEGIKRWKANLDKKLEGTDECVICYSVLHASTLKLPEYPCGTCKNKYHNSCMYKWFQQGHATCPLCRSTLG